MKNKGAAIAVCSIILIISVAYYFNAQSNRSGTDIMGIDKNWWDDPNEQEKKFEEQYKSLIPPTAVKSPEEVLEEKRDHYEDMVQLKATNSKRYVRIQKKIGELQNQLKSASSPQEAEELKQEISKRQNKMKAIKEDDQFIQLITGQ